MNVKHSVFVLSVDGKPISPTTPAKARKLLSQKVAKKVWSKFGTFGIRLLVPTRRLVPLFVLGGDQGTKYEGFSVVGGTQNHINVKINLPNKKQVVKKLKQRAKLRYWRRLKNTRQRSRRGDNRITGRKLAPSQRVLLQSRLKIVKELIRLYPISIMGYEDVWFDIEEEKRRTSYITVDLAREEFRAFILANGLQFKEFLGTDTKPARERLGYKKCKNKAADRFEAHNSDSLTMAVVLSTNAYIEPGPTFIIDDTIRPSRRRLKVSDNGGSIYGIRKGLLIGLSKGRRGVLIGEYQGRYRYIDERGKKQDIKSLNWISTNFVTRPPLTPRK